MKESEINIYLKEMKTCIYYWKKPVTKGYILYDSVYVKYLEYVNIETDRLMITTSWEEERIESNCLVGKGIYSGLIEKF